MKAEIVERDIPYTTEHGAYGFAMFDALRDVFCEKPADGWPRNLAPRDVGMPLHEFPPMFLSPVQSWTFDNSTDFESRVASAEVNADAEWHEYEIDLAQDPLWGGKVNELWFEGVDLANAVVDIGWMRFE